MKTNSLFAALVLLASAQSWAAGLSVETQSGRAAAMGTAVAGFVDDPSAVFYNPAGILETHGLNVSLGASFILPRLKVTPVGGPATTMDSNISTPAYLFVTYKVTEDLAAGFGYFTPFGASTSWPEGWPGQFRSTGSKFASYYLNPEVAYRVHERVRFGAGLQIARATVTLNRNLNFVDSIGSVQIGGASWAVGGNLGVQVDIVPRKLWGGISYRSSLNFDFEGKANFDNVPAPLQTRLVDQTARTSVNMPHSIYLGLGYQLTDTVLLSADAHWYDWSSLTAIDIEFANDPSLRSYTLKNWSDTISYHLGTEWKATRVLRVRGGLTYDPMPSPTETLTPDVPDGDRIKLSAGVGYGYGSFTGDLGYQFVLLSPQDSTAPGYNAEFAGTGHVLGLSLGYQL